MEPFITTYTGRNVNPLDLKIEDICIEDIAHHLACINRFVGALRRPVSVAQHSVYVSRLLGKGHHLEREALFHDATEAYLGDVSKWVKRDREMRGYILAEERAMYVIYEALDLETDDLYGSIKKADDLMVRFEALRELDNPAPLFSLSTHPTPSQSEIDSIGAWEPWTWQASERGFLDHARMLGFKV